MQTLFRKRSLRIKCSQKEQKILLKFVTNLLLSHYLYLLISISESCSNTVKTHLSSFAGADVWGDQVTCTPRKKNVEKKCPEVS